MKKLLIAALAFTVAVTSCKDRGEVPAPTNSSKDITPPVDTIDVRDIAAGTFVDSITNNNVSVISFVTDTNSIDQMLMYNNGRLIDTISIKGEDWGLVYSGLGFPRVSFNNAGYYTLETDIWNVRIVPEPADTFNYTFRRVN